MGVGLIEASHVDVGVFVNKTIVDWAKEVDQPGSYQGDWGDIRFFQLPDVTVTLREGDQLCVAALVTDNYGRQFIECDIPYVVEYDEKGNGELTYAAMGITDRDLSTWTLVPDEAYHTTTIN